MKSFLENLKMTGIILSVALLAINVVSLFFSFMVQITGESGWGKKPFKRIEVVYFPGMYTGHYVAVGIGGAYDWLSQPLMHQPKPADPAHPEVE